MEQEKLNNIETIKNAQDYINAYNLYNARAEDQELIFKRLKKCEQLAVEHKDISLIIKTRNYLVNYYIHQNELEMALSLALQNKQMAETENKIDELIAMYPGLIELYNNLGDYVGTLNIINEYEAKIQGTDNYLQLSVINTYKAGLAGLLKEFEKCHDHYLKSLEYAFLVPEKINLPIYIYNNIGYQLLEYDKQIARDALENGYQLMQKNIDQIPEYTKAGLECNLARTYLKFNLPEESFMHITNAISRYEKMKNHYEIHLAKIILCEVYLEKKQYEQALELLMQVEQEKAVGINKIILKSCYENMVRVYECMHNYEAALAYHKKLYLLTESIFNEDSNTKIRNLQIVHEVNMIKNERDRAAAMANLKHDFLANMSHEIRTPINSVLGISYLLQQDMLTDKQRDYVDRLQRSGQNLLGLINDILDISKIEAGKMELVPVLFNLKQWMQDIYQQLNYKAEEKGISFILMIDPKADTSLSGDMNRLTQVFINLLGNALKFTQEGHVTFGVQVVHQNQQYTDVTFTVSDSGIGMNQDQLDTIFERYVQASAAIQHKFGGTGLGLSISRKIIDLMGGHIEVNSSSGSGTTFSIQLKLRTGAEAASSEDTIIDTAFLKNKKILVADDSEENRSVMIDILHTFHPEIITDEAENGIEVLEKAKHTIYDYILMDLDMPGKNGLETLPELKQLTTTTNTKVIAHTASLLMLSADDFIEIGFDDLLQKPFPPRDLLFKLYQLR